MGEAVDNIPLTWTTGGNANWFGQTSVYYYDGDAAQSGSVDDGQSSWIETMVTGPGVLSFYWKVSSSDAWGDLKFSIDGVEKAKCLAYQTWELKTYAISSGSHTPRWDYAPFTQWGSEAGFLDKVALISGPAIIVESPNGDETWYHRSFYGIRWAGTEDVANMKMEAYKGASLSHTISTSTTNDGHYNWFVPSGLTPGTDYWIKITSTSSPSIYDYSDTYFSIVQSSQSSFGGALILDGTDDYAEAQDHLELDVGDEAGESLTVEARVNFQDLWSEGIINKNGAYSLFVEREGIYPNRRDCIGYLLGLATGQPCSVIHCTSSGFLSFGWHHAALTYDGATGGVAVYFDGKEQGSSSCPSISNSDGTLRVGQGPRAGDELEGAIDEIRISAIVRYSGDFTPPMAPFTCDEHTRALWHFDEFEGATVLHDACGVDNYAVAHNGAHTEGVAVHRAYLPLVLK